MPFAPSDTQRWRTIFPDLPERASPGEWLEDQGFSPEEVNQTLIHAGRDLAWSEAAQRGPSLDPRTSIVGGPWADWYSILAGRGVGFAAPLAARSPGYGSQQRSLATLPPAWEQAAAQALAGLRRAQRPAAFTQE